MINRDKSKPQIQWPSLCSIPQYRQSGSKPLLPPQKMEKRKRKENCTKKCNIETVNTPHTQLKQECRGSVHDVSTFDPNFWFCNQLSSLEPTRHKKQNVLVLNAHADYTRNHLS